MRASQINYGDTMSEEQVKMWEKVVDAFNVLAQSRRVWSVYNEDGQEAYEQVFFDTGIFDYIQSPHDTPFLRDQNGIHYYIYPTGILVARSSVDFDFYNWDNIELKYGVVDISTLAVRPKFTARTTHGSKKRHTDALTNLYGTTRAQVVGELTIPKLNMRWFVNHTGPVEAFVKAIESFLAEK